MKKLGWVMSLVVTASLLLSACGQSKEAASSAAITTVKIGILKNVTHAPGFIALQNNYFQQSFGQKPRLKSRLLTMERISQRRLRQTRLILVM